MGRQSSRIYFNGKDHKEMVVWDGSQFVYHDKAYIWTGNEFELVWEKLYGLKLLYESTLELQPVSSENNRYLYFVEGNNVSIIYRITIDDEEPEPEEKFTSNTYTVFTAPVSSRGIAIYRTDGLDFDYSILDLENGRVAKTDTFDIQEETGVLPYSIVTPVLTNQEVSPAESGLNHNYASILARMNWTQVWNFMYFVAITGISAQMLDNRQGDGTLITGNYIYDLGRMDDPGARGLLPRFLSIDPTNQKLSVYEYGAGTQYGFYSVNFSDEDLPFMFMSSAPSSIKVVRDDKIPVMASDNRIWFIQVNDNNFTYIDTEIDSISRYVAFDVSPDYKYIMTFEDLNYSAGTKLVKILNADTKSLVVDLNEELTNFRITNAYFVGHKCLFITGYEGQSGFDRRYRLYKWR